LHLTFSDIEEIEPLIVASAEHLRSLDLRPAQGYPPLSSQDSPILPLLDQCSSLRHLKFRIATQSQPPSVGSLIHETAVSHSYNFQSTLTILDICSVQKRTLSATTLDYSILHFASLFPELLVLHVCGQGFRIDELENTQTFTFPSLLRIDLQLYDVESTTQVLEQMEMPRLRLLLMHLGDSTEVAERVNRDPIIILALALQIKRFGTTLQTVKLRSKSGLYWNSLDSFLALLSPRFYGFSSVLRSFHVLGSR